MRVVKKKVLGKSSRIILAVVVAGAILMPLVPLGIRGAWTYTNRPEFCVSCHTMKREYQNWSHSAHRNWAGCGDCHVPQQSIVTKTAGKVRDGIYHGYAYAFDRTPDPVRISKHGQDTVMGNCIRCHEGLISNIHTDDRKCWECHRGLPHGY